CTTRGYSGFALGRDYYDYW
nr:immunoglobulin heavy chain junction region [Macaca mulatta]MOW20461.1 immunoglobulin heavy chain junction region [Macaca mulatta]MOW20517.1 immunoglobulin heavy chain junction region [Macaca mulatta]MOW20596.1 immunoglobulin heavy chain junction region [Macaca mulatta]MOW21874.1 immunoglobulin heavy chain junction region [Macaca mulatta]